MTNPRKAFEQALDAAKQITAASPNLEGPYADINADYAQVWVQMDSYGRIHHVTGDLVDAEKRLEGIRSRFRDALHKMEIPFKDGEIIVDGLPGGRNRMSVSFYFAPYGGRWDNAMQDQVTEALNGYGIRDYKAMPKTAAEHNPDPLTFKAFMSEFKSGIAAGEKEADLAVMAHPEDGPGFHGYITVANDLATSAAQDLLEMAKRIIAASDRGIIGVNVTRLVPKMSGILSTLFYQTGKIHGLNKPGGGPA